MSTEEGKVAPLATHLLKNLRKNLHLYGSRPWMIDAVTGTTVRFDEVDELSRRAASALYKLGFRRGHVLYFVTYEVAHLYVAMLAAWRLGGCVRGFSQRDNAEKYASQMRESQVKFVLLDAETAPSLREAVSMLEWPVCLINLGSKPVEGATNFTDLLLNDGKDCPDEVDVDVNEDVVFTGNTSGSTGNSKIVLHTSVSAVFSLATVEKRLLVVNNEDTCMTFINNYPLSNLVIITSCLYHGVTCINVGICYGTPILFDHIMKYKPSSALMYSFTAAWFIRNLQQQSEDLNFLKSIGLFGAALDNTSANLCLEKLPHITLNMFYASSECLCLAATNTPAGCVTTFEFEGKVLSAAGKPLKNVEIRVVDMVTGKPVGPGKSGEIVVKTTGIMRGYMRQTTLPEPPKLDDEGWYHMEDLGLMDEDGNVYIIERLNFLFRYMTGNFVSPIEIEGVLQEHEAVEAAGVVPVPDLDKINLARAFIVLRPGCHVTADEILTHVANRLPVHKQLHGGVRFVTSLPLNMGGKIDRKNLQDMITSES